jgi:hypothetical protein
MPRIPNPHGPGPNTWSKNRTQRSQIEVLCGRLSAYKRRRFNIFPKRFVFKRHFTKPTSSPVQDLTDPSLPYTACIIALANFPTNNNGAQDNGTCNTVFSSACYAEIISTVNRTASQWSNTATASSSSLACTGLLGGINSNSKSACYNQWFGTFSSRFIQNDFTSQNNSACSTNTNPGASDFTHRSFFSWSEGTQAKGNYTAYDNILLHPQPVIVAAFLKNTNSAGGQTTGSESAWADTRLLCLPANITTPDSRNITVARKESGASRAHSVVVRILGIVAFTVLVELS